MQPDIYDLLRRILDEQTKLRGEVTELRVSLMARMDRLQQGVDALRDDGIVNLGAAQRAERIAKEETDSARRLVFELSDTVGTLHRMLLKLESRVAALESKAPGP